MKSQWMWMVCAVLVACGPDGSSLDPRAGDSGTPDAGPAPETDGGVQKRCETPRSFYGRPADLQELEGCREVGASFEILTEEVTDLSALAQLEVVKGDLSLLGTGLKDLDGLRALRRVEGNLSLTFNARLVRVDGLRALESAASISVFGNNSLAVLEGWDALTSVSSFRVASNRSLARLAGFDKVKGQASFRLSVHDNPVLSKMDAFSELTSLLTVSIYDNDELTSLRGLNKLESALNVLIDNNLMLNQLEAFGSLKKVESQLSLMNLPALTSLQALGRLQTVPNLTLSGLGVASFSELSSLARVSGSLIVQDNPELTTLQAFSALDKVGDDPRAAVETRGVVVTGNPLLRDLTGLNMVVEGPPSKVSWLQVENNASLEHLNQPLRPSSQTRVSITSNPKLQSLDGLEAVTHLQGLVIRDNASLRDLSGLRALEDIGELNGVEAGADLVLEKLPLLKDLQGLEKLESVFGGLSISQCDGLVRLTGLQLKLVDWLKDYQVFSNPNLPQCEAQNLLERLKKDGYKGPSTTTGNTGTGTCP